MQGYRRLWYVCTVLMVHSCPPTGQMNQHLERAYQTSLLPQIRHVGSRGWRYIQYTSTIGTVVLDYHSVTGSTGMVPKAHFFIFGRF